MLWGMLNTLQLLSFLPLLNIHVSPVMSIFFTRVNFINSNFLYISEKVKAEYRCIRTYQSWIDKFNFMNLLKEIISKASSS